MSYVFVGHANTTNADGLNSHVKASLPFCPFIVVVPVLIVDPVDILLILSTIVWKVASDAVLIPLSVIALAIADFPLLTDVKQSSKSEVFASSIGLLFWPTQVLEYPVNIRPDFRKAVRLFLFDKCECYSTRSRLKTIIR